MHYGYLTFACLAPKTTALVGRKSGFFMH